MERVLENVVPFLGADRVVVPDAIRLAAVLPTDDNNEPTTEVSRTNLPVFHLEVESK